MIEPASGVARGVLMKRSTPRPIRTRMNTAPASHPDRFVGTDQSPILSIRDALG